MRLEFSLPIVINLILNTLYLEDIQQGGNVFSRKSSADLRFYSGSENFLVDRKLIEGEFIIQTSLCSNFFIIYTSQGKLSVFSTRSIQPVSLSFSLIQILKDKAGASFGGSWLHRNEWWSYVLCSSYSKRSPIHVQSQEHWRARFDWNAGHGRRLHSWVASQQLGRHTKAKKCRNY